jgi:hypothetical protein
VRRNRGFTICANCVHFTRFFARLKHFGVTKTVSLLRFFVRSNSQEMLHYPMLGSLKRFFLPSVSIRKIPSPLCDSPVIRRVAIPWLHAFDLSGGKAAREIPYPDCSKRITANHHYT